MGEAIDRLRDAGYGEDDAVALAGGLTRVKSYFRTSKTGQRVHVDAYTRKLSTMSVAELADELAGLGNDRTKQQQIANEIRRRKVLGQAESMGKRMQDEIEFERAANVDKARNNPGGEFTEDQYVDAQVQKHFKSSPKKDFEAWGGGGGGLPASTRMQAANMRQIEQLLEEYSSSKNMAMDDEDTAVSVYEDRRLLEKIRSGATLNDADYRKMLGMLNALEM